MVSSLSFLQQEAQRIPAGRGFLQDEGQSVGGRVLHSIGQAGHQVREQGGFLRHGDSPQQSVSEFWWAGLVG